MEPSEIDRFMAGLDPSSHSFTHCSSLVPRMGVSTRRHTPWTPGSSVPSPSDGRGEAFGLEESGLRSTSGL